MEISSMKKISMKALYDNHLRLTAAHPLLYDCTTVTKGGKSQLQLLEEVKANSGNTTDKAIRWPKSFPTANIEGKKITHKRVVSFVGRRREDKYKITA